MFVCSCLAVDDGEIRTCIARGARTVEEVGDACEAGTGCGGCHGHIDALIVATVAPSMLRDLPVSA